MNPTLIIILLIYLISIVGAYFFFKKAHSKYPVEGRWSNLNPDINCFIIIIFPFANTILGFMFILGYWKKDRKKFDPNLSKFFGVKK